MAPANSVYGNSVNSSHIRQICPVLLSLRCCQAFCLCRGRAHALLHCRCLYSCLLCLPASHTSGNRSHQHTGQNADRKQAQKQNPSAAAHQLHLPCLPRPHLPDFPLRKRPPRPPVRALRCVSTCISSRIPVQIRILSPT